MKFVKNRKIKIFDQFEAKQNIMNLAAIIFLILNSSMIFTKRQKIRTSSSSTIWSKVNTLYACV